jgi:histone methylation protein DOT1
MSTRERAMARALLVIAGVTTASLTVAGQGSSPSGTSAQQRAGSRETRGAPRAPDTVYIPTPNEVVAAMLKMAHVGKDDVVYDLGSGDGRIVIAAVKEFGARRGFGVELDETRNEEARVLAQRAGVSSRVGFSLEDLFETDLREATVVTLYLSVAINQKLRPKLLAELKPGARVVSHNFDMGHDWPPDETQMVSGRPIYLWTIPPR